MANLLSRSFQQEDRGCEGVLVRDLRKGWRFGCHRSEDGSSRLGMQQAAEWSLGKIHVQFLDLQVCSFTARTGSIFFFCLSHPVLSLSSIMATAASALSSSNPLPQRLMNFFAKYPPKLYSAKYTGASIPLTRPTRSSKLLEVSSPTAPSSTAPITSPSDPNESRIESTSSSPRESPLETEDLPPNPFLPYRNPSTNRWRGPAISLRRQAELVKIAQKYDVEPLLPPSRKSSVFKEARALEKGLRVKGTGIGERVKGHIWEREMPAKLEARRKAMEGMPALIRKWKQVSSSHVLRVTMCFADANMECSLGMGGAGRNIQNHSDCTGFLVQIQVMPFVLTLHSTKSVCFLVCTSGSFNYLQPPYFALCFFSGVHLFLVPICFASSERNNRFRS
jgi:large subunit ribosomal protein L25